MTAQDFTVTVNASTPAGSATLATSTNTISVNGTATLTVTPTNLTLGTDYNYVKWNVTQNGAYVSVPDTTTANTNTVKGLTAGTATITASLMKTNVTTPVYTTTSVTITVGGIAITSGDNNSSTIGYNGSLTLGISGLPTGNTYTYNWSLTTSPSMTTASAPYFYNQGYASPTLYANGASSGTSIYVTVVATITGTSTTYTASRTFTVNYSYQVTPTVTVYRNSNYNLNDAGVNNSNSIIRQITNSIPGAYSYPYVMFTDNAVTGGSLTAKPNYPYYLSAVPTSYGYNGGLLSDIDFVPTASSNVTKAEFRFTLYYYTSISATTPNSYSGIMTFNITGDAAYGDITYSASIGQDVSFDIRDFENYYYDRTRGTLNYVTFTLPSGGYLYSDRTRLGVGNTCFASPRTNQIDLAGVYFTPTGTTATRAGSVSIPFTAYGTNGASRAGTVVITYLSGSAKDITYTALNNNAVALRSSDFTDAYRQVVGSNAPSGLTIQFQDVPTNGTLTYKDSSRSSSTAVTLRSGNIQSYKFTTLGSGTNQLGDVTYTANSNGRSDTISYIAYNGSTPQFTGKVVFNANSTANSMSVILYSTGGSTASFNYNAFVTANAVVMAGCTSIRIVGMPTSGTLTYNGAAVSAAGTDILPATLSQVVYRPNAGFNGTDKVTFVCYGANGSVAGSGQVNIIVSGNASSSGGASNISQFKDVASNAWYATDLSTLVSRGIMQGKGEGRFDPTGELKYGEALKIFLLSAGYSAQEGTGKDWAAGYKTLAVNNGWISSNIDLDAKISRNAMAELAARVLGISSSSTVPPTWKDGTSNGYANALYYTNPQILVGNADGTFKGNTTLQRAEICKIAARVLNYKGNQQSTQAPGWLS